MLPADGLCIQSKILTLVTVQATPTELSGDLHWKGPVAVNTPHVTGSARVMGHWKLGDKREEPRKKQKSYFEPRVTTFHTWLPAAGAEIGTATCQEVISQY